MLDYFWPPTEVRPDESHMTGPLYKVEQFKRRFCMFRTMFNKIILATTENCSYLRASLNPNCAGKLGASPLQNVVAPVRQLAYGSSSNSLNEYCLWQYDLQVWGLRYTSHVYSV